MHFIAPAGYYSEWWNNKASWGSGDAIRVDGGQHVMIHGVLDPIPNVSSMSVHPPFGVNDGPDRYDSVVTFTGWAADFIDDIAFVHRGPPAASIHILDWYSDDNVAVAHLNLAAPLAPTGTYTLEYAWLTPWGTLDSDSVVNALQVVNSYVPTPIPTPTAVPTAQPTAAPVPAPQPTVAPTPAPAPAPVAGPVTVTASKVTVKRGQRAVIGFQVNESSSVARPTSRSSSPRAARSSSRSPRRASP